MSRPLPRSTVYLNKGRLEAFSDGVFAIAITLLVLDIKLPSSVTINNDGDLANHLFDLAPKLLSYVLSFVMAGIYWVAHHQIFHLFIRRVDRNVLWINNLLLLGVGFIPFSADLLGSYDPLGNDHPMAGVAVIYGLNLILIGAVLQLLTWYAMREPQLRQPDIDPHVALMGRRRVQVALTAYSLAVVLAFVNSGYSMGIYLIVPLLYLLPNQFDHFWNLFHRHDAAHEHDYDLSVVSADAPELEPFTPDHSAERSAP